MAGLFTGSLGGGEWSYLEEAANLFWSTSRPQTGLTLAFEDYIGTEADDTVVFGFRMFYRNPYKALIDLKGGDDIVEFLDNASTSAVDLGDGNRNVLKANEQILFTDIYGGKGEDLFLFKSPGWGGPNITRSTIKAYQGDDIVIVEKNPDVGEASLVGASFKLGSGNDAFLIKSSGETFGSSDSESLTTINLGPGDDIFMLEKHFDANEAITTARNSEEAYTGVDLVVSCGNGDDIVDISALSLESLDLHSIITGGKGNDQLILPIGAEISRFVESGFERISIDGEVLFNTIPEPEPYDGVIKSASGNGKLIGTKDADVFSFDTFDRFGKKGADKIIGFNSSQGDTIAIGPDAFLALQQTSGISFISTVKKKDLKRLSKQDYDFVYFEKKGYLYFDGNGSDKNWGDSSEGGLVAILKGKPELTADDFTLLS